MRIPLIKGNPYYCPSESGNPVGFVADVFNEAARRRSVNIKWVEYTPALKKRFSANFDVLPFFIDFPGRPRAAYLSEPWLQIRYVLLSGPGRRTAGPERGWAGQRVATHELNFQPSIIRTRLAGAEVRRVKTFDDGMKLVCAGEVEAVITESRKALEALEVRPEGCAGTPLRMEPIEGATYAAGIAATRPEGREIVELFRSEIAEMARDGTLSRLHATAFSAQPDTLTPLQREADARRRATVYAWALLAVGAMLAVVLALLLKLRATTRERELASRTKERFLSEMSHEFRTPLHGVVGTLSLLEESDLPQRLDELVRHSRANVSQVMSMLDRCMEATSVDQDVLPLTPETVDLLRLLEGVERDGAGTGVPAGAELAVQVAEGTPEVLRVDGRMLGQVLKGLRAHGARSGKSQVAVTVRLRRGRGGSPELVFETGISEPLLRRGTWSRAFGVGRGEHTAAAEQQVQLDLEFGIAKRLIARLGGRVLRRRSRLFAFSVPVELLDTASGLAPSRRGPLRVLVVDDQPVNRLVAERMIEKLGYRVDTAPDGESIEELVTSRTYDVVLMDCQMPKRDGYEATRAIRSLGGPVSRTPVVALTASALESDRNKCLAAGMDDFLTKPISLEQLRSALERWGARSRELKSEACAEAGDEVSSRRS